MKTKFWEVSHTFPLTIFIALSVDYSTQLIGELWISLPLQNIAWVKETNKWIENNSIKNE